MSVRLPKVTALVPSYNHAQYIQERIESILNQTYQNIELIVIDDCSEDESDLIIKKLQSEHDFKYFRNEKNSGSPFAAWEKICTLATGEYIWVCESDDVAAPTFLETAVNSLLGEPNAVMFYCSSNIINEKSEVIGHTDSYFHDTWKETRWDGNFSEDGHTELSMFQLRGQTVPNMSSALFVSDAFIVAFTPFIKRLRLTGDWLFVGEIMKLGRVIFSHAALSYFRKHEVTSRVRVKSARSQAEFVLTKYHLYRGTKQSISSFAVLMSTDVIRFIYEPASWMDILKILLSISVVDTVRCGFLLIVSTGMNASYIAKFKERYKHSKTLGNN